ncbi:helix-turn-helix domain-containing protein [Vulcanococcus limneticus]|uniref:helix-turn-helix domain-containing protein n=1 Tax=Vulcanococcus limneticus TaxID=2170428 RepID=UPI00398C0684
MSVGCVEQLAECLTASGLVLHLTQLAPGPLDSTLQLLRVGPLLLLRVRLDRQLHVAGPKLRGHQILALDLAARPETRPCRSHGTLLPSTAVFGLASHGDVHLTTADRTDLVLVVLDQSRFLRLAGGLGWSELEQQGFAANWLRVEPLRFARVRSYLRQLFGLVEASPGRLAEPGMARLIEQDLLPLLVEALAQGSAARLDRPPARLELVKVAQDWMHRHPDLPITLEELCHQVYASRRSLIQGFSEHLGMGPMAYLKLQRLHAVRRLLLAAAPEQTTVAAVAARFGFLSAGHFSRDYRRLFGELPRETLAARLRAA